MADKYIQIASFKFGLDSRRQELVSQPGVLVTCQNAHINSGGEVEKRKAFVKITNSFPANTFSLQDTDIGLVTFGSDALPLTALPVGVSYQRLVVPCANDPTLPASPLEAVTFSSNYLGKAFVLALTAVGTFVFYDGSLVFDSRNGLVLKRLPVPSVTDETIADLANDLAAQVNRLEGWSAVANVNENGTTFNGSVIIKSPGGVHFTPIVSFTSISGEMGATLIDQDGTGTPGQAASTAFELTGSGGTVQITAPQVHPDNATTADLTGGTVAYVTSLTTTATLVAAAINARTFITGYAATSVGAKVTVIAPVLFGADTDSITVVTAGGTLDTSGAVPIVSVFDLVLSPPTLDVSKVGTSATGYVSGKIGASVVNAVGAVSQLLTTVTTAFTIPPLGSTGIDTLVVANGANVVNGNYILLVYGTFGASAVLKVISGGGTNNLTVLNDGFALAPAGQLISAGSTVRNAIVWSECNLDGTLPVSVPSKISMSTKQGGSVTFSVTILSGESRQGYFCCIAQSAGATPSYAKKIFTVALSYEKT